MMLLLLKNSIFASTVQVDLAYTTFTDDVNYNGILTIFLARPLIPLEIIRVLSDEYMI